MTRNDERSGLWMVERPNAFATHWSDTPNTYGPFLPEAGDEDDGRKAAERFVEAMDGGRIYNARTRASGEVS